MEEEPNADRKRKQQRCKAITKRKEELWASESVSAKICSYPEGKWEVLGRRDAEFKLAVPEGETWWKLEREVEF